MYILDKSKLKEGDILLTTQKHIVSKVIRTFTDSDFSHAMLHVGGGSYIHSDGKGVHAGNLDRLLFKKPEYVKVLRISDSTFKKHKEDACLYARREVGKEYSVRDAIKTKNPLSKKAESNRQFCSRLVAQSYADAGLQLVKNPLYCAPQELDDSPYTEEVLNCVRKATEEEIIFANSENPLEKQANITNAILKEFRVATGSDAQTFEQLLKVVFDNPNYDQVASDILKKSDYLILWQNDIKKNPWRYNYDYFMSISSSKEEINEIANRELERATNSKKRFVRQYEQHMILFRQKNLQYIALQIMLYQKLIENEDECIKIYTKILKDT